MDENFEQRKKGPGFGTGILVGVLSMLAAAVIKHASELKYVYPIIMLFDTDSEPDKDKRIYRAFNLSEEKPEGKALVAENMAVFNAYFLGGLEVLHEEFVDECLDRDAYLQKMYTFSKNFYESQDGAAIEEAINLILNK